MPIEREQQGEFVAFLTDVMSYYRSPATEFLLDVWWQACKGFDFGHVKRALRAHVADPQHGQFPPKVADVIRQLAGTAEDQGVAAWAKVHDAMARVGAYQDVVFDNPLVHAVIHDMGGWPRLCRTEVADLSYSQHRFLETYRSLAQRGLSGGYPRVLPGERSPDADFVQRGLPVPAPVLVGDPAQCALVHANGGAPRAQITFLPAGSAEGGLLSHLPSGLQLKTLSAPRSET